MSLLRRHALRPEQWPWRRLWLPREVTPPLDSAGFLNDAPYLRLIGIPEPVPLDALADAPCVVALGDPGLGKSHAVQDYAAAIAASVPPDRLVAVDLGDYGSRDELYSHVFRTDVIEGWSGSGAPVHLILDSLDESPVAVDTVCGIVLDEVGRILGRIPRERLRLRIACRTAVMPSHFIHGLRTLLARAEGSGTPSGQQGAPAGGGTTIVPISIESDGCVVMEIAVLRRQDVLSAAAAALGGHDAAAAFLHAVVAANAGHFAARPITLRALLHRRLAGRHLGGSQADLYRDLCHELSGAASARPGARPAPRAPTTTLEQRYRVAARLAAAMLFGNRRGVWCDDGPPPSAQLLHPRDCDGTERVDSVLLSVDSATSTREALNTALFTGFSFDPEANVAGGAVASHQTFSEFMAADWVRASAMELPQVLSLLHDPRDPEQRVVPQLRQVAAWLASMRADVFEALASREPELLLASDVVEVPEARRAALVDALLERVGGNRVIRPTFTDRLSYERLNHPRLADQLTPILEDRRLPARVRHLAIEIARACRLEELTWWGAEIALDDGELLDLRSAAAVFVADVADDPARSMLMPLVTEPPAADDADELRGAALWASWKLFTPHELFTVLRHPRRSNWSGAYSIALREIAVGLDEEYVEGAAQWLARLSPGSNSAAYNELVEAALCLCLDHLDDDGVRAPLLTHIRRRLRRHLRLGETLTGRPSERVQEVLQSASEARRRLVTALLNGEPMWPLHVQPTGEASDGPDDDEFDVQTNVDLTADVRWIGWEMPELFSAADVPWALETLAALPAGDARRATWREVIRPLFHPADDAHLAASLRYRDDSDAAYATRDWSTYPSREAAIEALESARRAEQEAELLRAAISGQEATQGEPSRPGPIGERIAHLLPTLTLPAVEQEVETTAEGTRSWSPWARVFFELVRGPESGREWAAAPLPETLDELERSLTGEQLLRAVDAALQYLNNEAAAAEAYPPNGGIPWATFHGGAAALFIARLAPERLSEVTDTGWRRWLPTLVQYSTYNDEADRPLLRMVFAAVERVSPDALLEVLRDATDRSLRESRRRVSSFARRLAVSTAPVAHELARRAAARAYSPVETKTLLSELLREGGEVADAARTAAVRLLEEAFAIPEHEGPRADGTVSASADLAAELGDGRAVSHETVVGPRRAAGIAAAAALITGDEDAGWGIVGPLLQNDRVFAREVLLFAAEREHMLMSRMTDRLSASRLSDLYQIVQREFPPEDDPWHVGVYSPGPNDVIRQWRGSVLTVLENRATEDAVDALARIAAASPDRDWLVQTWLRATAGLISARWTGTQPRTLMQMARQPHLRQVESGEQLLDIINESVARLQRELQGELRSVVGLWDQQRPRRVRGAAGRLDGRRERRAPAKWRPKDEGHLANEIARHPRRDLGERGVIVGRELVVQVGIPGAAAGLRTDLDVRARPAGEAERAIAEVRVIIEVKGSWNDEVLTAMETQLVEDYLDPHQVRHGLYLVGAYTCDAWEESPEKRRSARLGSVAALRSRLDEQARGLSSALRDVRAVVLDVSLPAGEPRSARRAGIDSSATGR